MDINRYKIKIWDFWMRNHIKSLLLKAGTDDNFLDILPVIIQLGLDPENHKQQVYKLPGILKKYTVLHEDEVEKLFKKYDPFKDETLWNKAIEIMKVNKIDFFSEEGEKEKKKAGGKGSSAE